jgi:hypothetical protein
MAPRTSLRKKTTTVTLTIQGSAYSPISSNTISFKASQKTNAKKLLSKQKKVAEKKAVKTMARNAVKTVMNNAAKQRHYYVKDDEDSSAPCRVEEILDSKAGPVSRASLWCKYQKSHSGADLRIEWNHVSS